MSKEQTAEEIRYAIIKKNQRTIENNDNDEGITIVYDYHAAMEEYATLKLQEQAKEIERLKGEKLINVDFIISALNAYWFDANYRLTEMKLLGDIERKNLEYQRDKSKELMSQLTNH